MLGVEEVSQIEGLQPAADAALIRVDLDAINLSSQPISGPICALGYNGIVLVDDELRNYSVDVASAELPGAVDPFCASPVQPGLTRRLPLVFQIPKAVVPSIVGVAVWDPSESGDETGDETYYFVDARP